jgi:hypothetical protein
LSSAAGASSTTATSSTTNLSGATTTVSSISQSYIDLYLVIENVYPSNDTYPRMTVNADTTLTNYPSALIGTRAGGMANRYDNANLVPYGIDGTSHANQITITIPNYAGTTNKCWYVNSSYYGDDVSPYYVAGSGLVSWFGSAAISSVTFALGGAYTYSGGTVKIYGVK